MKQGEQSASDTKEEGQPAQATQAIHSTQGPLKLRIKNLQDFNSQQSGQKAALGRGPEQQDKKEKATAQDQKLDIAVPKLRLDRVKSSAQDQKHNHFYPLSDPDRGRKAFIRNLGLTQHELNLLGKQTKIKNDLRMALVLGDTELKRKCSIMKLRNEADKIGLRLSDDDYTVILLAFCIDNFESPEFQKVLRVLNRIGDGTTSQPLSLNDQIEGLNLRLNYDHAIKSIVPIVSKQMGNGRDFNQMRGMSIGWTVSKQAKIKAMRMQKYIRQIGLNNDFSSEEEGSESQDDIHSAGPYTTMGGDQLGDQQSRVGQNQEEARDLYAGGEQQQADGQSRADTRSRRSHSTQVKSQVSHVSSSKASKKSDKASRISQKSIKTVASADPTKVGKRTKTRSKTQIKDIMDHVYVLDKFISETKAQMAQQKKLKYLMVEASKQPQNVSDKRLQGVIEDIVLRNASSTDRSPKDKPTTLPDISSQGKPPGDLSKPMVPHMVRLRDGKNNDTSDIINQLSKNEFNQVRRLQIEECIRQFGINVKMITELKKTFLACDLDKDQCTTSEQLLLQMQERGLKYRPEVLNFFFNVLNVKDVYTTDTRALQTQQSSRSINLSDILSFKKLQSLQQIYSNCPMLTGDKRNNSRLIRDSLFNDRSDEIFKEHNIKSKWTVKEKMHLQKVLKRIHQRIEEKFGNYRQAFKAFDTNQDGTLSLEEFVSCCELQGIQLPIQDFQGVFGIIDYDGSGEIGYKEFCLLNTDKQNVFAHIETVKKKELEREAEEQKQRLKGKFGHLINLRKSVDNVSNKARSDDQQSLMSSNIGRQSVDISTGESDNMYMQIKRKQVDKPKPYAIIKNINGEEPSDPPKKSDINRFQSDIQKKIVDSISKQKRLFQMQDNKLKVQLEKNLMAKNNNWEPIDHSEDFLRGLRNYKSEMKLQPLSKSQMLMMNDHNPSFLIRQDNSDLLPAPEPSGFQVPQMSDHNMGQYSTIAPIKAPGTALSGGLSSNRISQTGSKGTGRMLKIKHQKVMERDIELNRIYNPTQKTREAPKLSNCI